MRLIFSLFFTGCAREAPEVLCRGTKSEDRGDDGTIDVRTALELDAQRRLLSEAYTVEDWLVHIAKTYDETGLVLDVVTADGEEVYSTRWERRTDGQPLLEEISQGDERETIEYFYDGDLLSMERGETWTRAYTRDSAGRVIRIDIDDPNFAATLERWYSEPAPSLDGGFRTDMHRDDLPDSEMEELYEGEQLLYRKGVRLGLSIEEAYAYRPDGQPLWTFEQSGHWWREDNFGYDDRSLPLWADSHSEVSPGVEGVPISSEWSWACEG